jgi:hypothetical protein
LLVKKKDKYKGVTYLGPKRQLRSFRHVLYAMRPWWVTVGLGITVAVELLVVNVNNQKKPPITGAGWEPSAVP